MFKKIFLYDNEILRNVNASWWTKVFFVMKVEVIHYIYKYNLYLSVDMHDFLLDGSNVIGDINLCKHL